MLGGAPHYVLTLLVMLLTTVWAYTVKLTAESGEVTVRIGDV